MSSRTPSCWNKADSSHLRCSSRPLDLLHSLLSSHSPPLHGNVLRLLPRLPRRPADCPKWLICRAQTRHAHNIALQNTHKKLFFFSFSLFAPFRLHLFWSRSLTKGGNLVHGSFRFQKRGRKHWTQSSDRKEDSESLNKSLPLSQIDTWLVLCLFHFFSGFFIVSWLSSVFFSSLALIHPHFLGAINTAQSFEIYKLKLTQTHEIQHWFYASAQDQEQPFTNRPELHLLFRRGKS